MPTLKFSKGLPLLLAVLLLTACASTPPAPGPAPEKAAAPAVESEAVGTGQTAAADAAEAAAAPEPVDFNQVAYLEAVDSLKNGNADQAVELLLEVSREAPDKPYVFTNLGLAYLQLQQPEDAEAAFRQAIDRNDRDAVAHNHLGVLKRQQGEFEAALERYQRAIEIDASYAGAHLNLGILYDLYLQDLEKALRQYQTYQTLNDEEDARVSGWIIDIQRQLDSPGA